MSDMSENRKYQKTLVACYMGFVTQAIAANFAPLLFLTFQHTYGISLEKIALIPVVFYLTQLLVDLGATRFADIIGYRICVVISQVVSAAGLVLMAVLPEVLPVPFLGILIAVVFYAIGSGLVEVLVSPIVEACPFENKDGVMSLLHSFYCWGAVGVILGSTLFFAVFGIENWKILTLIWALVPLVNVFQFLTCPIERLVGRWRKSAHSQAAPPAIDLDDDSSDDLCRRIRSIDGTSGHLHLQNLLSVCPKPSGIWPVLACSPFSWEFPVCCTAK